MEPKEVAMTPQDRQRRVELMSGPAAVVGPHSPLSVLVARGALRVDATCSVADAVVVMEEAGVSALLVGDADAIITERDIARALGHGVSADESVGAVATPHPLTVPGTMPVVDACATMLNEQVRHLVVALDGGVGLVSLRAVAAVLLQSAEPQIWLASLRVAVDIPPEIWLG